ncbi:MAG: competence/damage-inducible protein A [Verrucomicrobia subdivision 3 bacterium]|nr:competence/damage-inducible protein A [Limisphaerales bacterium]
MRVELINTGSELLLGNVLNTHHHWLAQQLTRAGYTLAHQQTVPDTGEAIQAAAREAIARAELVLITGGLGPTGDDLTRQLIAGLLDLSLEEDAETRDRITTHFANRNRPMSEAVLIQAQVPTGANVLRNDHGTAPGLALPTPRGWLILLPGPPRELRPMFTASVEPLLAEKLPPENPVTIRTLKTFGVGETTVEESITPTLAEFISGGLEIGYCARAGEVDVRFTASGKGAVDCIAQAEALVREKLGPQIYGVDDELMEDIIIRQLTVSGKTLAVAESCTGGLLAHHLTNVPGASAVFLAGHCTYSNEAKQTTLGVKPETLAEHGAVSEIVARQMAEGARATHGADYALATTGIAGPDGGTPEKPVGTVFIACATPNSTEVVSARIATDRETFKQLVVQRAMNLLRLAQSP